MLSPHLAVLLLAATQAAPPATKAPSPTATPPPVRSVLGEVTAFDPSTGQLRLRPDQGDETAVEVGEATVCLKVPPGSKSLAEGTSVPCTAIVVGDRIFARGTRTTAQDMLAARQIVLMTKDELAEKRAAERDEWRRRGIGGVVTAVDTEKREITIEIRSIAGARDVVIAPAGAQTTYLRYAPGSARFSDARPCAVGDVRVGDQLRALGDRSPDGARFLAEQVVAGAFQTLVGTVVSVEPDASTLVLKDVVSARGNGTSVVPRLTIALGTAARLRRLPLEMAQRLGARAARRGPTGQRAPEQAASGGPPPGDMGPRRREGPGGEGGRGPANPPTLGEMLDRFPVLALSELAPGELVAVAVADEKTADGSPVRATALLAGIEPLLIAPRAPLNNANLQTGLAQGALDLGMGMGE